METISYCVIGFLFICLVIAVRKFERLCDTILDNYGSEQSTTELGDRLQGDAIGGLEGERARIEQEGLASEVGEMASVRNDTFLSNFFRW